MKKLKRTIVVGLTGGAGVGKSVVARLLEEEGASVVSADEIGRDVVEKVPGVLARLADAFGRSILTTDGSLHRAKLGRLVFADARARIRLNKIVHPPLLAVMKRELKRLQARPNGNIIVVDAALIFEWGIANWCDYILVVTSRRDLRIRRMRTQGLTWREASQRISSQMPQRQKVALADFVIENNGTRSQLKRKVGRFLQFLREAEKAD